MQYEIIANMKWYHMISTLCLNNRFWFAMICHDLPMEPEKAGHFLVPSLHISNVHDRTIAWSCHLCFRLPFIFIVLRLKGANFLGLSIGFNISCSISTYHCIGSKMFEGNPTSFCYCIQKTMVSDDDLPANPLILPFPSTQAQVSCDLRRTMKLYGIKAWHASVEVGIPKYVYIYIFFFFIRRSKPHQAMSGKKQQFSETGNLADAMVNIEVDKNFPFTPHELVVQAAVRLSGVWIIDLLKTRLRVPLSWFWNIDPDATQNMSMP